MKKLSFEGGDNLLAKLGIKPLLYLSVFTGPSMYEFKSFFKLSLTAGSFNLSNALFPSTKVSPPMGIGRNLPAINKAFSDKLNPFHLSKNQFIPCFPAPTTYPKSSFALLGVGPALTLVVSE